MMQSIRRKLLLLLAVGAAVALVPGDTDAAGRQYYSGWRYHSGRQYHYRTYYYKPTPRYTTYRSHYCIYKPSRPRYVYYYNRYKGHYWGRFDTQGKPGAQYSLLKPEDRKAELADIPESAFPKPGAMPTIPEAEGGESVAIEPITDLPNVEGAGNSSAPAPPGGAPAPPAPGE